MDLLDGPRTGTLTPEATDALAGLMMGGLGRSAAAGGVQARSGRLLSGPGVPGEGVTGAASGGGRTPQPINGATRTVPLGFEQEAQFLGAMQELQGALKASGITDATVGVRGSSVAGHNPYKGTTFHSGSDVDFFVESSRLADGYKTSAKTPGFVHPDRIMRDHPHLREWATKWTKILGRKVTSGAFIPGTLPNEPAILVK